MVSLLTTVSSLLAICDLGFLHQIDYVLRENPVGVDKFAVISALLGKLLVYFILARLYMFSTVWCVVRGVWPVSLGQKY